MIVVVMLGEVGETNKVIKFKLPEVVDVFFVHCL